MNQRFPTMIGVNEYWSREVAKVQAVANAQAAEIEQLRAAIRAVIEIDERGETLGPGHIDALKALLAGAAQNL